jgi:hypothetical protein
VTDRIARLAIRAIVVLSVWAAIAGEISARFVLSHGSGTYFGMLVFLPLLVAPGAIAWRWPTARSLGIWAGTGWFATIVWAGGGSPYYYERHLSGWKYVATPVWIAVALVLFVVPAIAMLIMEHRTPPRELELLAARLRRIALLVLALAAVVIVTSFSFGGAEDFYIAAYVAVMVAPVILVQRDPRPLWAWLWSLWCAPFAAFGLWLWLAFGGSGHWFARVLGGCVGTIYVLLLVGVPLVCVLTRRDATGSSARASYRSRSR